MPLMTKVIEEDTAALLETTLNTFLATLDPKNVLDVVMAAFASSKYGQTKSFVATVVYKE